MQPMFTNRRVFLHRPFWRNYLVAYLLIGAGFLVGDVQPSAPLLEVLGATMFIAGLLIFAIAIGYSVWFVAGGKPPWSGAA